MLYLCRVKPLRHYLRGFLIAAWAGDKIAEFSFPEISFHFSLRPWFFFVSPAYAGKRGCRTLEWPDCRDHPRVCGEKSTLAMVAVVLAGSPPRMRGKVGDFDTGVSGGGITPRVCGEKAFFSGDFDESKGSPPRMRGKEFAGVIIEPFTGITPACAGKRQALAKALSRSRDHPRMCGEKESARPARPAAWGSPPRMRGKD